MAIAAARRHPGFFNAWGQAYPRAAVTALIVLFVSAGAYTTVQTRNYLTVLWRIANCDWRAPGKNFAMDGCAYVISDFYRNSLLLLDIDPRVTKAAREADVILTGNSTAFTTFTTKTFDNQIELFFRKKGLKLFIVAAEGSGFRFRSMIYDKQQLRPKIAIPSLDDLAADALQDSNRELVFNPDQFIIPFHLTRFAIELQHAICTLNDPASDRNPRLRRVLSWLPGKSIEALRAFYCHGTYIATWKNLDNGIAPVSLPKKETNRIQLVEKPESDMREFPMYWRRAQMMISSRTLAELCLLLHLVPSGHRSYDSLREVAKRLGNPFVFPDVKPEKNWWLYDGSHMYDDTAERWTAEFLAQLEPQIDKCLAGK